jgi:pimeloyl-[acyl-carrier protein] methyl ester esterase
MDGASELSERFCAVAPPNWPVHAWRLPDDQPRGYSDLADRMLSELPGERFAIIAQSFSGPLAILLANRCPRVRAVVLCASFVYPPLPKLLAPFPGLVARATPPQWAVRFLMTGGDPRLAGAVRGAIETLDAEVLAGRIRSALHVDVRDELGRLSQPLLSLRAARDRLVRMDQTAAIRAVKPSAEFATVDAPHLLLQTSPSESWRHIEPFLEAVWRRAVL